MRRISQTFSALVAILLLSSCGAIEFAYDSAPSFVASEFDEAFDLTATQSAQLDARLQRFFAWHRRQELNKYREILERASVLIADGIRAPELLELADALRAAWQTSLAQSIDELADLAPGLSAQQVANYERYFRDSSEKYSDYLALTPQQREIDRLKRNMERLESWFGNFDEFQTDRISRRMQRLPDPRPAWISYREARQQALLDALRAAPEKGLSRQQLKFILLDPDSDYARAYEKARGEYWQAYAVAIEDISRELNKSQLRHALDRLQYFAEIVDSIAAND